MQSTVARCEGPGLPTPNSIHEPGVSVADDVVGVPKVTVVGCFFEDVHPFPGRFEAPKFREVVHLHPVVAGFADDEDVVGIYLHMWRKSLQ